MSDVAHDLTEQLQALKRSFDLGFAEPPRAREAEHEALLGIEVSSKPYAVRARELLGLYVDHAVTALPAGPADLLGLAAVRGELVAVYDLASLLGYAPAAPSRYLLLARGASVAFACDVLSSHIRAAPAAIARSQSAREPWLHEVVREREQARPIIELAGLCAHIERRVRSEGRKEND